MRNQDFIGVYEDFQRMCPFFAKQVYNWEPLDSLRILVELYDGEAVVYDGLLRTYRVYGGVAEVFKPVQPDREDQWRREFSKRLYRQMVLADHTQETLAYSSGLSAGSISKYLNQVSTPTAWNIVRLARVLDCDIRYLIDFD